MLNVEFEMLNGDHHIASSPRGGAGAASDGKATAQHMAERSTRPGRRRGRLLLFARISNTER